MMTAVMPDYGYVETLRRSYAGHLEIVVIVGVGMCIKISSPAWDESPLLVQYIPVAAVIDITPASAEVVERIHRAGKAAEDKALSDLRETFKKEMNAETPKFGEKKGQA